MCLFQQIFLLLFRKPAFCVSYLIFCVSGNLLHILSDPSLQLEVLDILHKLLNRLQPVGLDNVKLTTCIRSLEVSFLTESLADLLIVAEPQIVQPLLNIILRICILSEYVCKLLCFNIDSFDYLFV